MKGLHAALTRHFRFYTALAGGLALTSDEALALCARAGIDPQRRAETLTLDEWGALARAYAG